MHVLNIKANKGSVLFMTVFGMLFMIGMTALVTDIGWVYYNKSKLETSVNAGWKAGFDMINELRGYNNRPLNRSQRNMVEMRIREIALLNGLTEEQANKIEITISPRNELEVHATYNVGLFFARALDISSMSVAGARIGGEAEPVYVLPLAMPHGVVKDLSARAYDVTLFPPPGEVDPEDPCGRFQYDVEYIIKLGEGEGLPDQTRLLVPMAAGDQSMWGFRRAYGAAYWCLAIDENDNHYGPVDWLLGYRGGAFLLIDAPEVRQLLNHYGVNYEVITGNDNINAIYETVGDNVMEIWDRPRIAVYSSTNNPDPVELVLRRARIPYGPYSLPPGQGGWARNQNYNANNCSSFYDEAILSGELDKYHWLHLHHEDFTGFSGGCRTWRHAPQGNTSDPHCRQNYLNNLYGPRNNASQRASAKEFFCDKCYEGFNHNSGQWHSNIVPLGVLAHPNTSGPDFGYLPGTDYELKRSPHNGGLISPGNFGALNLNPTFSKGGGANAYRDNLSLGYQHPIQVGHQYFPQTGHMRGPTDTGVTNRINANRRNIVVPVVDSFGNGASVRSRVIGFLNFRLVSSTKGDVIATYLGSTNVPDGGYHGGGEVLPYVAEDCRHYKRRCAEFATHVWWKRHEEIKPEIPESAYDQYLYRNSPRSQVRNYICYSDDTRPNCRGYNRVHDIATDFGFTDDLGSVPKPQASVLNNGSLSLDIFEPNWFDKANRVQKMKWQVVNIIKDHYKSGGFLFAQCFAPETYDLALFQDALYNGATLEEAYGATLAFHNFTYHAKPYGNIPLGYSTINTREYPGNQPFNLQSALDPRCQNHGRPDTRTGHTAAFVRSTVKPSVEILGIRTNNNNRIKYVGSDYTEGEGVFTFLGGHHQGNIMAERLVLNNILFGSLSEKEVTEGSAAPIDGRLKRSYGPVDPSNSIAGEPDDYLNRLKHGFTSPLQLNDRLNIIPEDNKAAPSIEAVTFRVDDDSEDMNLRRVVVPITDIGPEIAENSPENADALTIYDMIGRDDSDGVYDHAQFDFNSSVRIIGFAEFELLHPDEYTRAGTDIGDCHTGDLGSYQTGQIRGRFIRYIVDPHEIADYLN